MNKKKIEAALSPEQKALLEELSILKQIIARENSEDQKDQNESETRGGITIAKNLPHMDFEDWKNLVEEYGLYNWLAIPQKNDEELLPYLTDLLAKQEALLELAEKDPLTEISNRRGLKNQIETEIERCKRLEISLSLVMLDIDDFKQINDTYGHNFGDQVLQSLVKTISKSTRKTDHTARYGGEEFIILMSGTGLAESQHMLDRLLENIRNIELFPSEKEFPVKFTVSAGLMCYKGKEEITAPQLLEYVDQAMYQAKNQGKDRYVTAPIIDLKEVQKETQVQHQEKKFLLTGE